MILSLFMIALITFVIILLFFIGLITLVSFSIEIRDRVAWFILSLMTEKQHEPLVEKDLCLTGFSFSPFISRIVDLDSSIIPFQAFWKSQDFKVYSLKDVGRIMRLILPRSLLLGFVEKTVDQRLGSSQETSPTLTFYGDDTNNHFSLLLLRRIPIKVNVIFFDNHLDSVFLKGFEHCGSWMARGLMMENVNKVFHIGSDESPFEHQSCLEIWPKSAKGLLSKLHVFRTRNSSVFCPSSNVLRSRGEITISSLEKIFAPHIDELRKYPLYFCLDKDCIINYPAQWSTGQLSVEEFFTCLRFFINSASSIAGADVCGDHNHDKYYYNRFSGWYNLFFHYFELLMDDYHLVKESTYELNNMLNERIYCEFKTYFDNAST